MSVMCVTVKIFVKNQDFWKKGDIFDILWIATTKLGMPESLKVWKRCSEIWTMQCKKQNGNNLKNVMAIKILVN